MNTQGNLLTEDNPMDKSCSFIIIDKKKTGGIKI